MNQNVFLQVKAAVKTVKLRKKMVDDVLAGAVATMRETKHFLNPPTKEKDLINKWFAVVHASKHKRTLYIAKFVTRFLANEDGPVDECLMRCLKPKIDSRTLLVDNPKHLPPDDGMFHSSQFIAGPLEAVQKAQAIFWFQIMKIFFINSGFSIKRKKITFKEQ